LNEKLKADQNKRAKGAFERMMQSILMLMWGVLLCFVPKERDVAIYSFEQLEQRVLKSESDTLYVINFWATWCKPCVEELPELEAFNKEHEGSLVKTILVSLDFKSAYENKLLPFVEAKQLESEVLLLDAKDYNSWIEKVHKKWEGAIPATLIRNAKSGQSRFVDGTTTAIELNQLIKQIQ